MDKKSRILLWFLAFLILGSITAAYWRIVIKKDYVIEAQVDCDPMIEKCFVYTCDPLTEKTCTGNLDEDVWYYQNLIRVASNIPYCDPVDEDCKALTCPEGEVGCNMVFCDEATKTEEEVCSDPVQYAIDNPVEGEVETCNESDVQCAKSLSDSVECDATQDSTCADADVNTDAIL